MVELLGGVGIMVWMDVSFREVVGMIDYIMMRESGSKRGGWTNNVLIERQK